MADDYITNWYGKPISDLSRGDLVDALDWCVKELRKHNAEYHHQSKEPVRRHPSPVSHFE